MKFILVLMCVLSFVSLAACNVKEAAESVGDAGNSLGKVVDDTINRENVEKD